jgi:RTX calcium-binding nonapeptide repeat (4 copies)
MSTAIANQMFLAYLGRPADSAWRTSTANLLNGNQPTAALQSAFYSAAVSEGVFSATDSTSTLVNKIFLQTFGFGASTFEQTAWSNLVTNGTVSKEGLAWTIFSSYLGATNVPAAYQTPAQSKLIAIDAYTNQLSNDSAANLALSQGGSAATLARSYSAGVTTQATAATAVTNVSTSVASLSTAQTGSTLTLTTATDNITGTTGNDLIIGDFATTAQASDQINGGAGVDTLRLFGTYDAAKVGSIIGVETVNLVNQLANADVNLSTVFSSAGTGTTSLILNDVSLFNAHSITVGAGQTLSLATAGNVGTAGALTVAHSATDTTSNLVLNGYQGVSGGTPATTTYNLTSQGAANAVTTFTGPTTATTLNIIATTALNVSTGLVADHAATVNISGASNVTIAGSDFAATVAVNASTATGNVAYTAEAGGSTLTFTGGSGNDSVTFAAGTFTTADKLTGGLGTDTIVINDTTPVYAAINATTGFEVVRFATTGGTLDVAQVTNGINSFGVGSGALTETFTNALSTSTFAINTTADNAGNVTITNKTGEFTTTVTLDASTATAVHTLATLTLSGSNVINLVSAGTGTGGGNIITDTVTADNVRFNISGRSDLTITNAIDGVGVGTTVDASTFTGKLSLTGTGFNDAITGGSGADTLNGGAGKDVISGGDGADVILVNNATQSDVITLGAGADKAEFAANGIADLLRTSAGTAGIVSITDFVAGTDKIGLLELAGGAMTSVVLAAAQTIATAANLTAVYGGITAIAASADHGAASAVVVTVSAGAAAGTYLYVNDTTAGVASADDMLINITGITGTLAASDFIFAA